MQFPPETDRHKFLSPDRLIFLKCRLFQKIGIFSQSIQRTAQKFRCMRNFFRDPFQDVIPEEVPQIFLIGITGIHGKMRYSVPAEKRFDLLPGKPEQRTQNGHAANRASAPESRQPGNITAPQ